jgi:hypothetical protein
MPSEVVTAFSTAVASIKTDVLDFIVIALPVALAIFGTILAIKKGKSFFSTLTR